MFNKASDHHHVCVLQCSCDVHLTMFRDVFTHTHTVLDYCIMSDSAGLCAVSHMIADSTQLITALLTHQ